VTNDRLQFETKDSGLILLGSILTLDVDSSEGMNFISEPTLSPIHSKQIIMSEDSASMMEAARIKTNALQCQYNRPFMIGNYKLELLPSGKVLGGASLFLETKHDSLLYAPRITLQKQLLTRKAQLRKAKTLVLKVESNAQVANHSIRKEKERLVDWALNVKSSSGVWPVIYAPPFGLAQEVIKTLDQALIPTLVHPSLVGINSVYTSSDFNIGKPGTWSKRSESDRLLIIPSPVPFGRRLSFTMMRPSALIYDSSLAFESAMTRPSNITPFLMDCSPTIAELKEIIKEVSPERLYLFGTGAKSHASELKSTVDDIKAIYKLSQPSLF
jgi:hypothetical protein